MNPRGVTNLCAAALCLALWGCGRSTSLISSSATSSGAATGANAAADASVGAIQTDMQSADSLRHGPCGPAGLPIGIPTGCAHDAGSGSFVCGPDLGEDGLTPTRSYAFLDGGGTAQAAYDPRTTASIHFESSITGTATHRGVRSGVDDHRTLTESGLEGDETTRIWNGAGSSSRTDSIPTTSGEVAVRSVQSTTSLVDVVVPAPWARDSWPLSGTITTHLVRSDGLDQTSVLTFNGTEFVPLTVDGTTVTIDLAHPPRGGGPVGPGRPPGRGHPPH